LLSGAFTILYGLGSVKIKQVWYLGEALPALLVGIILGPIAAKFIDSERWGSAEQGQTEHITLVSPPTAFSVIVADIS
jgi:NhaP-type Na+/H+ or K+/H+ antiporter